MARHHLSLGDFIALLHQHLSDVLVALQSSLLLQHIRPKHCAAERVLSSHVKLPHSQRPSDRQSPSPPAGRPSPPRLP
ncbi:hypothetical protein D3C87_1052440 [compost metagenome]